MKRNSPLLLFATSTGRSFARCSLAYKEVLRERYRLTTFIEKADLVILDTTAHGFNEVFKEYPLLKQKYVIGYTVWEANQLPRASLSGISRLREIWTPSTYSQKVFQQVHPCVFRIPHITSRDARTTPVDMETIAKAMSYDPQLFYFLTITQRKWDRRKNIDLLIAAFLRLYATTNHIRLIIKSCDTDDVEIREKPFQRIPAASGVIWLNGRMTHRQINALYKLSDAYVSPHHGEAWGLTLSDAMLLKKLTIGTAYSGNMDFMTRANSLLLRCREESIRPEDCQGAFEASMKWAYVDQRELQNKMKYACDHFMSREIHKKIQTASRDIRQFNRNHVKKLIFQRIDSIWQEMRRSGGQK